MGKSLSDKSTELNALISSNAEALYEDAPCGYIFLDPQGYFIKANRTFLSWTGYTHDELTGMRFPELLSIGSRIYYETNYSPLLRMQGFLNEVTLDITTRSKSLIPVLISSSELRDGDGKPLLIRSTVFNITDRRRYEKELLNSRKEAEKAALRMLLLSRISDRLRSSTDHEKNFQAIADMAVEEFSDICVIELESGKFRREAHHFEGAKTRSVKLYPRPEKSLLVEDAEQEELPAEFAEVVEVLEPQSLMVCAFGASGKTEAWISFYLTQLGRRYDEKDLQLAEQIAHTMCTAIETAALDEQKKKAEAELRESHEWFSTTLKSIGDAVITIRPDKTMEFLNPVAEELTGWTQAEALGRPMEEVFNIINAKTGGVAFNPVDKVLREGVVVELENNTALIRRDGSRIIIEDSASPIKANNGSIRGVVLIFRDTTLKHKEESDRLNLIRSLKEEKDVRERFVATLSHDLRSPLTAAKLNVQLIEKFFHEADKTKNFCSKTINSLNRVDRMIQDLLDANQLRSGIILNMSKSQFNMVKLVEEVRDDLALIHGDRFKLEAPQDLSGIWNEDGLRRILENLCNNAIKYGSKHTPVSIRVRKVDELVNLSVHNQGNPIPQEDLAHLFDPYKRLKTAQGQKGWGLGLTLVKGFTDAHSGSIEVSSSAEHGTTFTISLPRNPKE
jgi:PAS domain S-box-containing protein